MTGDELYRLLRHLTPPVAAITTSARGRRNGFIVNSAQRASLVPSVPRISLYVSKPNFSHQLVYDAGVFTVHLLRDDQWDLIRALGMRSARDVEDKLAEQRTFTGDSGAPVLRDVVAAFECRVINAMDAGGATFFLGDVIAVHEGTHAGSAVMTSAHFRANAPVAMLQEYEKGLSVAQGMLEPMARTISRAPWPGPVSQP